MTKKFLDLADDADRLYRESNYPENHEFEVMLANAIRSLVIINNNSMKALRFAREEFDRISYQKKADANVLEFIDLVLKVYK